MAELKPYKGDFYLWDYLPSTVAAVIFIILFIGATGFVGFRMVKTRTWFSIPFVIGGLCKSIQLRYSSLDTAPSTQLLRHNSLNSNSCQKQNKVKPANENSKKVQILGYIARAIARNKTDQLGPYVMQSVLILVAPALFAASIYMTLGRLMRSIHGERHSLIPVKWLTRAFVLGDVFSFLIQSTGGGLMAAKNFPQSTGQNIILGGLFVQIIMFGLFAVTAVIFHMRMRKWPSGASMDPKSAWTRVMMMLYATSALIMVRSIFRVVEYIMGKGGYLLTHEWTLYVFDAVLMLGTMVVYAVFYPADLSAKELGKPRAWDAVEGREDEVRLGGK